jgi:hypothetical protein
MQDIPPSSKYSHLALEERDYRREGVGDYIEGGRGIYIYSGL